MLINQGVISGFVFCQQDVRRLQEPDLLLRALEFKARAMDASFILPGATECFAEQGGSREGWPQEAQSSPTTSFPSCVQPLLSLGLFISRIVTFLKEFQIMKAL